MSVCSIHTPANLPLPSHACKIFFFFEGNHHSKSISFCQCEHPIVTLVRLHLWPGSPDRPTTAFHFRLMDMATDMFIHCKVSLREFADVLEEKRPPLQPKLVRASILYCTCICVWTKQGSQKSGWNLCFVMSSPQHYICNRTPLNIFKLSERKWSPPPPSQLTVQSLFSSWPRGSPGDEN